VFDIEKMNIILPGALERKFLAIADCSLRRKVMADVLLQSDAQTMSLFLEHLFSNMARHECRALYFDTIVALVGKEMPSNPKNETLLSFLEDKKAKPFVSFLWEGEEADERVVTWERDYDMDDVPLGVRKAKARLHDKDLLMRLCDDPHPDVISILLSNPMACEEHALKIASLRPQSKGVFLVVLRSRFGVRERVLSAIAQNPYCPKRIALALLPLLARLVLLEVSTSTLLDRRIVEASRQLLQASR
jgi:hypothetical protein